jgi:hypothetical protein
MHARTDGRTENIYSIFRDKLLLPGEHVHGGAHTTHTTHECHKYEKDGTEKSSFRAAKKGGKKNYPMNQNFAQLTKKIEKLETVLKKSRKKARNATMRIAILTLNRELGQVALGKS